MRSTVLMGAADVVVDDEDDNDDDESMKGLRPCLGLFGASKLSKMEELLCRSSMRSRYPGGFLRGFLQV